MVVAGSATGAESKENCGSGGDLVSGVNRLVFLIDGSALAGGGYAAVKPGSDFLIEGSVWKEVAGDLFTGELIEGHILEKGLDDPVTIRPDPAVVVIVNSVSVAVAGCIEPMTREVFGVVVCRQELCRSHFNGSREVLGCHLAECRDFLRSGREAG